MPQPKVFRTEDMLTVPQFAKAIGMSRRFVYLLVEKGPTAGGVTAFRYGEKKGLQIPKEELHRYRESRRVIEV